MAYFRTFIFLQNLTVKALTFETLGNYEQAKESYRNLCQSSQQNQESRLWSEGYVLCLENLCEWKSVSDFVDDAIGTDVVASINDDIWKESFLLQHFVSSKLHIMAEEIEGVVIKVYFQSIFSTGYFSLNLNQLCTAVENLGALL